MTIERFFATARERQNIYLKKERGEPFPWTEDEIFKKYKFTNVFREQDRNTVWLRKNVREKLPLNQLLLATVIFRWFNRLTTAEAIFTTPGGWGESLLDHFYHVGNGEYLEKCMRGLLPHGSKIVTGAYFITSPTGYDKLGGMCRVIEDFWHSDGYPVPNSEFTDPINWKQMTKILVSNDSLGLEQVWGWLKQFPYQGPFHAHEVVIDLRHTPLLENSPDINTWSNPGPGCQRGLARIAGRDYTKKIPVKDAIEEMKSLLELSRDPRYWPQEWQPWELHQVEMWCCEHDKAERVRLGEGKPRSIYKSQG